MEAIVRTEKPDFVQLPYSVGAQRGGEASLARLRRSTAWRCWSSATFEAGSLFATR